VRTIYFDVDTQLDFVCPSGALYAPGAEALIPAIAALNRYAAGRSETVISTMDAHAEDDVEFRVWPHHCVAGTLGQRKAAATLLENRVVVANGGECPELGGAKQILIEKQTIDAFDNRHLAAVLAGLKAERFVVYGVVTEVCVRHAAWGLLKTGARVEMVEDAVGHLNAENGRRTLRDFCDAGGYVVPARDVLV